MKNFTAEKGANWISTETKKKKPQEIANVEAEKGLDRQQNYIQKNGLLAQFRFDEGGIVYSMLYIFIITSKYIFKFSKFIYLVSQNINLAKHIQQQ